MYQTAFSILLSQRLAASQIDMDQVKSDFEAAVLLSENDIPSVEIVKEERKTGENYRVTVEEVEDEAILQAHDKVKAEKHLLYHITEDQQPEKPSKTKHPTLSDDHPDSESSHHTPITPDGDEDCLETEETRRNVFVTEQGPSTKLEATDTEDFTSSQDASMPPPPKELKPIRMSKKRFYPTGELSVGISVLSVKGRVGNQNNVTTDLRLDSCADVTLISAEYYNSLKSAPAIQQGMRMKLWQLTDKDSTLKGFVRIPIFMMTEDGTTLESEAEAYVVPGMTVPILLGEDYQLTYEIGVTRNVEEGPRIRFGKSDYEVSARHVEQTKDFECLRQSAYSIGCFIRSKLHCRNKNKRHRLKLKFGKEEKVVRAKEDYRLRPHECKPIQVEGQLEEDRDWLVTKTLLSGADDSYFAVPNTLISTANPWIPVTNPTNRPRYIRKGEIIGVLNDPVEYFDHVKMMEDWQVRSKHADALAAIIQIQMDADRKTSEEPICDESEEPKPNQSNKEKLGESCEEESYGPKTAEMPDLTEYPSSRMKEFIDVGSLPDHLKDKAWDMLERQVKAFGFDGRLGHLLTKVHIRTQDGQVPISVPMYGSSPEKRRFMDVQIDTWFEEGVMEPLKSPWSTPVVIAYCHGKPRFCIDYRKLNTVTTLDEFPIPRQSEILSSLLGAQVLSSLDTLSSFTQLELDPNDIEKTAFRTHRGLFQFKSMPFGLRNGPSIFQRVMQGILSQYLWLFCLVYIDDIVVYSKSYEDHIENLDLILGAIEKSGLILSPKKCHLFYGSILLLGHKVSRLGLSTHLEKVKAILDLERPRKLSQLQTFLGMVVYFSAFIPYYASICNPLFHLLRKGA